MTRATEVQVRPQIRQALTHEQYDALFQFRYRISVVEMRRAEGHANHEAGCIRDVLDDDAINLIAWSDEQIVGCLRINLGVRGDFGYYTDFYEIGPRSGYGLEETAIVTRLMISPEYQSTGVGTDICAAAFATGLRHGVRWCFMDCQASLVRFFANLGFVEYAAPKVHKDYGESRRMRLDLGDRERLYRAGSPLTWNEDRRDMPA